MDSAVKKEWGQVRAEELGFGLRIAVRIFGFLSGQRNLVCGVFGYGCEDQIDDCSAVTIPCGTWRGLFIGVLGGNGSESSTALNGLALPEWSCSWSFGSLGLYPVAGTCRDYKCCSSPISLLFSFRIMSITCDSVARAHEFRHATTVGPVSYTHLTLPTKRIV